MNAQEAKDTPASAQQLNGQKKVRDFGYKSADSASTRAQTGSEQKSQRSSGKSGKDKDRPQHSRKGQRGRRKGQAKKRSKRSGHSSGNNRPSGQRRRPKKSPDVASRRKQSNRETDTAIIVEENRPADKSRDAKPEQAKFTRSGKDLERERTKSKGTDKNSSASTTTDSGPNPPPDRQEKKSNSKRKRKSWSEMTAAELHQENERLEEEIENLILSFEKIKL